MYWFEPYLCCLFVLFVCLIGYDEKHAKHPPTNQQESNSTLSTEIANVGDSCIMTASRAGFITALKQHFSNCCGHCCHTKKM